MYIAYMGKLTKEGNKKAKFTKENHVFNERFLP